ncbi:MAG: hypothetical protein AAGI53_01640 [Planctomycetota bacterium]
MANSDAETLEALKTTRDRLIAGGVTEVGTAGGQTWKYQDLPSLHKLIETYEDRVANAAGTRFQAVAFGNPGGG